MAVRSTIEPDIERFLGMRTLPEAQTQALCDTESASLMTIAGRVSRPVTLISYGLRAAIIHSSIRVRPIHCSYPQACFRQDTGLHIHHGIPSLPLCLLWQRGKLCH